MSRETLLIQVNTILQSCAEIISELQSMSNENDHQKQCSCICSCSKSSQSNVSVQQSVCSDIQEDDDWLEEESAVITSLVSRVSQNDSAIYTLTPSLEEVYTNIVEGKEVNDDVFYTDEVESNTSVDQSTTPSTSSMSTTSSAATMSSTSSTSLSMSSEESSTISSDSNTFSNLAQYWREEMKSPEDEFINSMSDAIDLAAPRAKYDPTKAKRRRRRKLTKSVHPELRVLWQNVAKIVSPPTAPALSSSSPEVSYTVDWSKVNTRFLTNLPKPQMYRVLGVSNDPDFYDERKKDCKDDSTRQQRVCNHYGRAVHGEELGYMTDHGVIPVHNEVIHGYVFCPRRRDWVLHAEQRTPSTAKKKQETSSLKKKPRRKKRSFARA